MSHLQLVHYPFNIATNHMPEPCLPIDFTMHHIDSDSCRVQQTVLQEGTSSGIFSILRRTIARPQNEHAARILQVDPQAGAINTISDEALRGSYKANSSHVLSCTCSRAQSTQNMPSCIGLLSLNTITMTAMLELTGLLAYC